MPPTVLDGDSAEFQYMAYILGVPHSTGYPLYILLAKLFTFLPFGDVAYRVNLFSVVCAALTIPLVYAAALRMLGRRAPAALAALILAVTPSIWGSALETKTYALNLLLGVLAILFALRWHQDNQRRDFYWLALVFGLGLTNHRIIVFIVPALLLVVWFNRHRLDRATIARGIALMLLPLLLYAYVPIRAEHFISQQDPENWKLYTREDAILKGTVSAYYRHTLDGFLNLVTAFDNSYKIKSPLDDADRIELAVNLLMQQFGIAGIALAIAGGLASFRRDRKLFAFVLAMVGGIGGIALYLRGLSAVFYFSLAYLALAFWIGFGTDALLRWAGRVRAAAASRAVRAITSFRVVMAILLLLPLSALVVNYPLLDESDNYAPREYAQTVLNDHLAPNAVVIAPWEVSQPIRYFQFVENERADVLVASLSPLLQRQFETMLKNARALGRPFYWVQFEPELKTPGAPRSAQAVPLPLMQEPRPRYPLQDARVIGEVQVLGYDLEPDPPQPGKPARVLIYYRALARMFPMYSAILSVSDITGRPWLDVSGFPATFYFPTYRWHELGEFYRDAWVIHLPPDAPRGLYNLDLHWYVYDLETRKPDFEQEHKVALGAIRVGELSGGSIAHAQSARVGDALAFLGWSSQPAASSNAISIARGQSLDLDLFWRADRATKDSYTVFVHLIDAGGRVVADADAPPLRGLFPTDRWTPGETVRDRHALAIPANLAPGTYAIEIGMYLPSSGARLPIASASERGDKILLTQVSVR